MIINYKQFVKCLENSNGKGIDKNVDELAWLNENMPDTYRAFSDQYEAENGRKQPTKVNTAVKGSNDGVMSYAEFKRCFERLDKEGLQHRGEKNTAMGRLSELQENNKEVYNRYRDRLHRENCEQNFYKVGNMGDDEDRHPNEALLRTMMHCSD